MFEQELRSVSTFWQLLVQKLLNHPRTSKSNKCAGLGQDDIAQHGKARSDSTCRRVGEQGDKGETSLAQAGQSKSAFSHLHQRKDAFMHGRSARGRDK